MEQQSRDAFRVYRFISGQVGFVQTISHSYETESKRFRDDANFFTSRRSLKFFKTEINFLK